MRTKGRRMVPEIFRRLKLQWMMNEICAKVWLRYILRPLLHKNEVLIRLEEITIIDWGMHPMISVSFDRVPMWTSKNNKKD